MSLSISLFYCHFITISQRFLDLNLQSVATLREHKQFYALYNTQMNKQSVMTQEVAFLNSIHENFDRALQSTG